MAEVRTRPKRQPSVGVGDVFGRLTVVLPATPSAHRQKRWLCKCVCGEKIVTRATCLTEGYTSSCGCLYREILPLVQRRHGDKTRRSVAPEYSAWINMKTRCTNPKHNRWKYYGGRGITVCDRWRDNYEAFLADMGRRPSPDHSLDRYPNNDGNYEPDNCRWATGTEQRLNQRRAA